jgi:hypothetical protein
VSDEVLQPPLGRPCANHPHARRHQRPLVHDDDHIAELKLNIPPFEGRYNPDAYLSWELEVEQCFACLAYPEDKRVTTATCEFTSFASIWWSEYCRVHLTNPPTTWDALKCAMRTHFVPPYYQRDLLKKLARLEQGKNSIEEYYQELQTGMIRCDIEEDNEALIARFFSGLNKEMQTVLEYKEYNTINRLFHLACKAECEVQDRRAAARTKFSAGRSFSWAPRMSYMPCTPTPSPSPTTPSRPSSAPAPPSTRGAPAGPATSSSSSMVSTRKTSKVKCHKCT